MKTVMMSLALLGWPCRVELAGVTMDPCVKSALRKHIICLLRKREIRTHRLSRLWPISQRLGLQTMAWCLSGWLELKGWTSSKLKGGSYENENSTAPFNLMLPQEASTNGYNRQETAARYGFQERVKLGQLPGPIPRWKKQPTIVAALIHHRLFPHENAGVTGIYVLNAPVTPRQSNLCSSRHTSLSCHIRILDDLDLQQFLFTNRIRA